MIRTMYHVTVLSNFARGYDKYSRMYSKARIPESSFPDRFYLLSADELSIGVIKATRLLDRLALPGNRLIALEAAVDAAELRNNDTTGLGQFVERGSIHVTGLHDLVGGDGHLQPLSIEDATACSFRVLQPQLIPFKDLRPRSLSVLPIARGCQADCPFCFSRASVSAVQIQSRVGLDHIVKAAELARKKGAERFVITGGGEPGLVPHERLLELMAAGSRALGKTVLITNGHHLTQRTPEERCTTLKSYAQAGLEILAVSRHHFDDQVNAHLMGLHTTAAEIAQSWRDVRQECPNLRMRFTCVLQRGGIDSAERIAEYLDWTAAQGVAEICFKELYVSTSVESVYHAAETNRWSAERQVPLALVVEFAEQHGFREISRLPWGSPVYQGAWNGRRLQIAAYTEPSLLWERTHGVARSWNLMADGTCLASLEDRASEISLENRE